MLSCKEVLDDVRHKEGYGWKVMHASFKIPVCSPKDQWGDSVLLGLLELSETDSVMGQASRCP
jgi:hypothetical protein